MGAGGGYPARLIKQLPALSNNSLPYQLFAGKDISRRKRISVAASLQLCIGKSRNKANDSFGKGFHVLKDHVLNRLMTGRCPSINLQLRPKFHSLFLRNSLDFQ